MAGRLIAILVLVLAVGVGGVATLDQGLTEAENGNLSQNESDSIATSLSVGVDVIALLSIVVASGLVISALRVLA